MIWTVVLFSESENVQIVNGKKTTIEKFPWTASVNAAIHWIPLEADLKCTAVIIGKKWILSAAHCNDHPWFHYYFIRAGSNAPTWWGSESNIKNWYNHSHYNKDTEENDITIIELII